jgi:diaminopimelate decarboxylase
MAHRYGTPLYFYNLADVRARTADLIAGLPAGARVLYSLKANPLLPIVSQLRAAGCGAEVSSPGELDVAGAAGFDATTVLYTGPGKTVHDIEHAVTRGVSRFSCESATELQRLSDVAAQHQRQLSILLRLTPTDSPACQLSMGDGRHFGFQPREAVLACAAIRDGLAVDGFHVYVGSQLTTVDALVAGAAHAKETIEEVATATGVAPRIVDLGGGFPWPYAAHGQGCELAALRNRLETLLANWCPARPTEVWFESGRRLTAAAGSLLTTVVDVKKRTGGVVVVVDAGINVLGGMSGLGRVLRPSATFHNLSSSREPKPVTADVVGPLCTPLDRLAARTVVDTPHIGDVLQVPNVGAYGLTASLTSFLSREAPLELVLDGDTVVSSWRLSAHTATAASC